MVSADGAGSDPDNVGDSDSDVGGSSYKRGCALGTYTPGLVMLMNFAVHRAMYRDCTACRLQGGRCSGCWP